jgi:hypothetical protein
MEKFGSAFGADGRHEEALGPIATVLGLHYTMISYIINDKP